MAKSNGKGVASLVLGIVSIVFTGLGIIPGVIGLILAMQQKKVYPNKINTVGFITSIIGIILSVIVIIWTIIAGATLLTLFM